MKYKKRYLKELYKDPIKNFKEIMDVSIYLDSIGEFDFSGQAISAMEEIELVTLSNLLINDLKNRTFDDYNNFGYQAVWWGLLNTDSIEVYESISKNMNKDVQYLLNYWLHDVLEPDDLTYVSIKKLFTYLK
jgi:hypothetical protein